MSLFKFYFIVFEKGVTIYVGGIGILIIIKAVIVYFF